jgi:hypothetical protein
MSKYYASEYDLRPALEQNKNPLNQAALKHLTKLVGEEMVDYQTHHAIQLAIEIWVEHENLDNLEEIRRLTDQIRGSDQDWIDGTLSAMVMMQNHKRVLMLMLGNMESLGYPQGEEELQTALDEEAERAAKIMEEMEPIEAGYYLGIRILDNRDD